MEVTNIVTDIEVLDDTFVRNAQFIKIKKCCASCAHKGFQRDDIRICALGEGIVKSSYVCPKWQMREELEKVGRNPDGLVKRKAYLNYVNDYMSNCRKAMTYQEQRKLLIQLQEDFEKENKVSIYLNPKKEKTI